MLVRLIDKKSNMLNMLKILAFLMLLACSSLFVTEAFSLEVEIKKESDRIIESFGWLTPEKHSMQEHFQIIIDETTGKNRISFGVLSTNPNDLRFTDVLEALGSNPDILSMIITNQFACAPNEIDKGCIIIEIKREGLGDELSEIKKNTREITDEIVASGVMGIFKADFYSTNLEEKISFDGNEKIIIAKATYTIHKQPTDTMFTALSAMIVSSDIRTSGGFYNNLEKLSEHFFADFTLTLIPSNTDTLRSLHVALTCGNNAAMYPNCPEHISKQIARGDINPLDFIQVENINRSKIFEDRFLPLNSVIQILIFSEQDLQVKTVNSDVIEKLQQLGDVQDSGWFFASKSGKTIDARYIFGTESSASKNGLAFTIGPNTGEDIEIKKVEEGGGCLIATASFGSEMAPQVQFLREIRDNTVLQTESGSAFMTGFNQFYYSFSPVVADYERENSTFKEAVKLTITPLLTSLTLLQYVDIDSESEMLGYGIGVILLNIGMYFVAPAVLIMKVRKRI